MAPHAALILLTVSTAALAQPTKHWKEDFRIGYNYDDYSTSGPAYWASLPVTGSEWEQFVEHSSHDLDIRFNECGWHDYTQQSPIHLIPDGSCQDKHEILFRKISAGLDCTKDDIDFEITPYGLRAYYPENDDTCLRPIIDISFGFPHGFVIKWMEIKVPAEHVIAGRRYDAELQMVHLGSSEDNDLVATVSILIDASSIEDNAEFQWLLDGWQKVYDDMDDYCDEFDVYRNMMQDNSSNNEETVQGGNNAKEETRKLQQKKRDINSDTNGNKSSKQDVLSRREENRMRHMNETAYAQASRVLVEKECKSDEFGRGCEPLGPRQRMYPYTLWPTIWYYRYQGSITSPPCTGIVNWRILEEPMKISRRQYKKMALLSASYRNSNCEPDSETSRRGENARPLQKRRETVLNHDHEVWHCTREDWTFRMYEPDKQ